MNETQRELLSDAIEKEAENLIYIIKMRDKFKNQYDEFSKAVVDAEARLAELKEGLDA